MNIGVVLKRIIYKEDREYHRHMLVKNKHQSCQIKFGIEWEQNIKLRGICFDLWSVKSRYEQISQAAYTGENKR